ncbi:enoyl-CoA hydratase/isomerase family protein [Tsukamurella sp. 8F]|uniref:enoyl-CoA hydratase/isomerase family protein n=1 Tax=unclassified Tsukamurella TaxID=2633480 RepID=UPI0023B904CB|nr:MULTISPECIES: enoyl-CoA hydratase/isomerase family protein [unclassified Tsukamurella]MDF0528984.1 enoyl-CoA hydratase/isomerase family protein [Tsukamurella sp. 8J]MDF0587357.1 enoyl-CoA hydratase/isomerase family protein [Tsukamurella sp. 8F]
MSATTALRVERNEDRYVLTLDRPAVRNAIDAAMIAELHAACGRIEADPAPVIVVGAGDHFAGGADIAQLRERGREEALAGINRTLFDRLAALPSPTVAAVSGYALGGGAELAYACDIRVAAQTAVFGNPEPGLGIIASAGASYRLPALVGQSVAKQVLLAGRTLDAEAAYRHGLVIEIVPAGEHLEAAHRIVDRFLRSAPLALRLTKTVVDAPGSHPWADDIAQAVLFETTEKYDRMTAFLEKRR